MWLRLAALAVLLFVLYGNRAVLPVQKASWEPWFGEPGPPTGREVARRHALPRNLTVHLVPHSHSDVGWNLSFEGYYRASVHEVLRRVVAELWADGRRRFTWGDLAFLDLWMREEGDRPNGRLDGDSASLTWRQVVVELVRRGQWEMVGGTYVSPDEGMATWWAHNMIVDVGHRVLAREFNATTAVAWQIDNFGHATTMAHVLRNTGYQNMVLGRMSFRDRYDFASRADLQFLWQSAEHGTGSPLLVHYLAEHYTPPSAHFDFDRTAACDTAALLRELLMAARRNVRQYPAHGHILVMMGDDFRYRHAARAFACLDRLVAASQTHGSEWADMTLRYSTVSEFFGAIQPYLASIDGRVRAPADHPQQQQQQQRQNPARELRLHTGEFYPYQDKPYEQYWSGILASRPYLKWLVRDTEQIVQHIESLVAMLQIREATGSSSGSNATDGAAWAVLEDRLEHCRKQVAIGYHHDAITGTCTDEAFEDYARRLRSASRTALAIGHAALRRAGGQPVGADDVSRQLAAAAAPVPGYNAATRDAVEPARDALEVAAAQCGRAQCAGATVVVTNANLLSPQDQIVRLRVHTLDAVLVDLATGAAVPHVHVHPADGDGAAVVEFLARDIPAFGLRSYALGSAARFPGQPRLRELHSAAPDEEGEPPGAAVELHRDGVRVRLTAAGGDAVRIEAAGRTVEHQIRQYFANPFVQASGAYVMHSFPLMYALVFCAFGAALCAGLAAAWVAHMSGARALRALRLPRVHGGRLGGPVARAAATACVGGAVGAAFVYYAAQAASVDRLNDWTRGRGLPALVCPVFACAYVAAGVFRWRLGTSAAMAHGVAAGVGLALLLGRTWQSRPLAAADRLVLSVHRGTLCDRVQAHVAAGIAVEYALCADAPGQLQIRSHVLAPPDREVVARFTEAGEAARELAIYDGAGVRRRRAGRWTPVPGTFYPAPSHVALGRLVVHARQPMGASCIAPGVLELMMHRSMTANDYRGLLQPLTDRTPVTVTHLLDLPQQEPADALRLAANHRANAPPLVFVLPAEHALPAAYAGAAQPAAAVRLVGIRARRAEAGPLQVDVRVAAHEPIDIPPAGLLRGAGQMAEAQGDWALCDLSAARRTFAPADRIRLAAGEQKLLRVAFSAQSASLIAAPLPPGTMARGRSPDLGPPITASVHSPSGP